MRKVKKVITTVSTPLKCWGVHDASVGTYAIYPDKAQALDWVSLGAHGTMLVAGIFLPDLPKPTPRARPKASRKGPKPTPKRGAPKA